MQRSLLAILLLAPVLLTGCRDQAEPPAFTTDLTPADTELTCVYESADGFSFVAAFRDTVAWVFLPRQTVALPRVLSASGAKYSDGQIMLWSKGQDAILSRPGLDDLTVTNNPRKAVWEHAKLQGMDFRAVGNEPGWVLELWGDGRVVYRGDYGQTVLEFTRPEPVTTQDPPRTTYTCTGAGHELVITLELGPCQDTMADEQYETSVTLLVDGQELRGCGKALH
jgi:uncharacterized membrane protein